MRGYVDFGFFFSSGRKAFFWAFTPLFVLALVYFSPLFYFKSVNKALEKQDAFIESAPLLEQKIRMAEGLVEGYRIKLSKADPIETLNAQMNQMALNSGFTLNSLAVEREAQDTVMSIFKVSIKGEGQFYSVIRFFNETFGQGRLISLKTANLRKIGDEGSGSYIAEFIFLYHAICD